MIPVLCPNNILDMTHLLVIREQQNLRTVKEAGLFSSHIPLGIITNRPRLCSFPGITALDLSATVTSPGGVTEDAEIGEVEDGLYAVQFVPKELGVHTVSVRYKDIHIPGNDTSYTRTDTKVSRQHPITLVLILADFLTSHKTDYQRMCNYTRLKMCTWYGF